MFVEWLRISPNSNLGSHIAQGSGLRRRPLCLSRNGFEVCTIDSTPGRSVLQFETKCSAASDLRIKSRIGGGTRFQELMSSRYADVLEASERVGLDEARIAAIVVF